MKLNLIILLLFVSIVFNILVYLRNDLKKQPKPSFNCSISDSYVNEYFENRNLKVYKL